MDSKLDFKEAFAFLFQKNWFVVLCQVIGLILLPVLFVFIAAILFAIGNPFTIAIGGIVSIITIILLFCVSY